MIVLMCDYEKTNLFLYKRENGRLGVTYERLRDLDKLLKAGEDQDLFRANDFTKPVTSRTWGLADVVFSN